MRLCAVANYGTDNPCHAVRFECYVGGRLVLSMRVGGPNLSPMSATFLLLLT